MAFSAKSWDSKSEQFITPVGLVVSLPAIAQVTDAAYHSVVTTPPDTRFVIGEEGTANTFTDTICEKTFVFKTRLRLL